MQLEDLTLEEFAAASNASEDDVLSAEAAGELFSCAIGDEPFSRYPAYQLLDGVRGPPLRALIREFGSARSSSLHMFMRSAGDLLGGLSAVEMLCGQATSREAVMASAFQFLESDHSRRVEAVLKAAACWLAAADLRRDKT